MEDQLPQLLEELVVLRMRVENAEVRLKLRMHGGTSGM
jgi:hypothetical protein